MADFWVTKNSYISYCIHNVTFSRRGRITRDGSPLSKTMYIIIFYQINFRVNWTLVNFICTSIKQKNSSLC